MLPKYVSKLFLVQENLEHNTRRHGEWHVTVVAHLVLSNLLGNRLPVHDPRNRNHGKGTGRTEKSVLPRFGSCSPHTELHPHGQPSPLTAPAPLPRARWPAMWWPRCRWVKTTLLFHRQCFCPTSLPLHSTKSKFVTNMFCKSRVCFFSGRQCSSAAVLPNIIRVVRCNNQNRIYQLLSVTVCLLTSGNLCNSTISLPGAHYIPYSRTHSPRSHWRSGLPLHP